MKTVILCGGLGYRLSDEEDREPKPLTRIGDIPIIEHIMNIYDSQGFNDFVLCLGYKAHLIKEYFKNYYMYNNDMKMNLYTGKDEYYINNFECKDWIVDCIDTGKNTATGSRIKKIKRFIDERFFLTYGDGVSDIDLNKLLEFHRSHGKFVTVSIVQPKGTFGVIEIDENLKVINFQEKPREADTFINIGFFVVEPDIFDYIEDDDDNCWWESDVLPKLVKENQVMAYKHDGEFKAMDSPKDKKDLEELWNSNNAFWNLKK